MNNKRRQELKKAISFLDKASEIVSEVLDQEEDSIDNIPENLQSSERYESMENVIEHLEEAENLLDEARDSINEACTK